MLVRGTSGARSAVSQEGPEADGADASAVKGAAVHGLVMLSSPPRRLCHMGGRMSVTG